MLQFKAIIPPASNSGGDQRKLSSSSSNPLKEKKAPFAIEALTKPSGGRSLLPKPLVRKVNPRCIRSATDQDLAENFNPFCHLPSQIIGIEKPENTTVVTM